MLRIGGVLSDGGSDGVKEGTEENIGQPQIYERREESVNKTWVKIPGSTITYHNAKTIAVTGGSWKFDRVALGSGGKGRGGGRLIPIPSDGAAISAAIKNALQHIDERHASFGPLRKRLRLELNGEDDFEVERPPIRGFSEKTKLAWSGQYRPGNLFDKIKAAISDSRQYTKPKGLKEEYQNSEFIASREYLQSAVRIIGTHEELIEELRMWLGLGSKSTSGTNQQSTQAGAAHGVQTRDFTQPEPVQSGFENRTCSCSVISGNQIVVVQQEHEAEYQRLTAMDPPRARRNETAATS